MLRCYIDYQNARKTLLESEGVEILSLDLHNLIEEMAESVGDECTPTHRAFTGIHSKKINVEARDAEHRIYTALKYRQGIDFFTRNLYYTAAADGSFTCKEKGIDVRIASEIVAAAATGEVGGCLLWSADQDLSEAITVAKTVAAAQGRDFKCYSVQVGQRKAIYGTTPIRITAPMLYRHRLGFSDACERSELLAA